MTVSATAAKQDSPELGHAEIWDVPVATRQEIARGWDPVATEVELGRHPLPLFEWDPDGDEPTVERGYDYVVPIDPADDTVCESCQ